MELRDLFTSGSRLADVPPHFRGMPFKQWRRLQLAKQCSEYLSKLKPEDAPLSKQRIWNPRDSYGLKGT
jgi:hypothetical protein